MDAITLARKMRGTIGLLAMHWLMGPDTDARATAAGMPPGIPGYAVGRLGVLGDCPVDNVVGAAFFWEPTFLAEQVRSGRATTNPADGASIYAGICQRWGEDHLAGFDGVVRLGELAERITSTASPLGAPTFVGWRDQELPEPGAGRTMQLCQTLRELGFGRFCIAVQAAGMSPLEAIMSGPTGAWNAEMFGWKPPFPDGEPLADTRDRIEADANRLHSADFEVLTGEERAEFRELARAARNHATSAMAERAANAG